MKSVFLVAEFEFMQTAKRWQFLAVTLALPAFLVFITWVSVKSGTHATSTFEDALKGGQRVLVEDSSGLFSYEGSEVFQPVANCVDHAEELLGQKHYACLRMGRDYAQTAAIEIIAPDSRVIGASRSLVPVLKDEFQKQLIQPLKEEIRSRIFQPVTPHVMVLTQDGGVRPYDYNRLIVPALFMLVFILSVSTASTFLLQSVSEEKENRTMEMVLSMVADVHLIAGKALGLGAAALLQVGIWSLMGILTVPMIARSLGIPLSLAGVPWDHWMIAVIVLILGFIQFAALMIGTGALGANFKDSQQLSTFFLIGSILPIYMIQMVISDADGWVSRLLYYLPVTAPVIVVFRYCVSDLPPWEVGLGILSLFLAAWIGVWLSVKMFRIGSLIYNRRPSLKEIRHALSGEK